MATAKNYVVTLDNELELVSIKNLGDAPATQYVVPVVATSTSQAIRRAKDQVKMQGGNG